MKKLKFLFFLLLCSCLQTRKSPFDISSPSGMFGIGGSLALFASAQNGPPTVTSVATAGGGIGIQFTFSKTMEPSSITVSSNTGTFQMVGSDGLYLDGTISTADNTTFVFRSITPLTVNLDYSIKILKSVTDTNGITMNEDYIHASSHVLHKYMGSFGSFGSNPSSTNNLGQFDLIPGVAVDSTRNIVYITDHSNQRVQSYNQNTSSFVNLIWKSGSPNPFGIAVDSLTGNVYYSESGVGSVVRLDYPGWGGSTLSSLTAPRGIALDSAGNVYIAERTATGTIKKYTSSFGVINTSFITGLNNPSGVAIDSSNNVYIANEGASQIKKYDSNGTHLVSWGTFGSGNGQLGSPIGVAADSNGYIYVAEWGNNRIQKFDSNGNFILVIGGPTAGSGIVQFNGCTGVAVDSSGNIYVADQHNHRVQKFGPP